MKKGILTGPSHEEKAVRTERKKIALLVLSAVLIIVAVINFNRSSNLDIQGWNCYSICKNKHINQQHITNDILPACPICSENQKLAYKCIMCGEVMGVDFSEVEEKKSCSSCRSIFIFPFYGDSAK